MSSYETLSSVWHKTLSYSNIFDYPLTNDEIYRFAVTGRAVSREEFDRWFIKNKMHLTEMYAHDETYWAIRGREALFTIRERRNEISKEKLRTARLVTLTLFLMPWVKLIAVTGTTAAGNANAGDDIDLYIVTSPKRTWLTRLVTLGYLSVLGRRHHPNKKQTRATFCLNHIVDTNSLEDAHQDIYIASEIARMRVLWERNFVFSKLVAANSWMEKFVPHWFKDQKSHDSQTALQQEASSSPVLEWMYFIVVAPLKTPFILLSWLFDGMEDIAGRIQEERIRARAAVSQETNLLTVHQHDNRQWILREFREIMLQER